MHKLRSRDTSPRATRRAFLRTTATASLGSILAGRLSARAVEVAWASGASQPAGASVGSLFPFIQSQAVKGEFPLSFLNPRFRSLRRWKHTARGKLLELLHYAPAKVAPAAETLERVDCGDYVRERVRFNTTPDMRVPAFVLVPKPAPKRAPAIVALHDHGAFYLWGKEKLVEIAGENPALAEFRRQYYGGRGIAVELVRQGYVVVVIDMFYWGDRRMLLDGDPEDWRTRPADLSRERIQAFNRRSGQSEQLVGRTIYSAGFTWPGVMFWDDIRTVDYPDVAALALPTPLLVINGSKDGLFHLEGVKASFAKLQACYVKAGVPDRCRTRLYDTPHEFNGEMQAEAWAWLRRWI